MIKKSRQSDYNFKEKNRPRGFIPATNRSRGTPALFSSITTVGMNRKYSDIFNFYGDRDRDSQESWKIYLEAKFRQSTVLFPSELEKIDYVRDYYKGIAFDVIKTKVDSASSDLYTYI